jgi:modulator of FtsH protease HflK
MAWGDKGGWQGDQGPWGRPSGNQNNGGNNQSGGGGNEPPPSGPDIDEVLRKLSEALKNYMPGGGNDKDGNKGALLFVVIALLLWMSSGIYFVKADEQGVVKRFGEYHRTTGAGVNYHWPYPIETAETPRVTTINRVEIGYRSGMGVFRSGKTSDLSVGEESLMLTGDENIIDIDFELQWKIDKAEDYLFNIRHPEDTVKAVAESAMREVIGQSKIVTVLAEGKLQVEQDTKKLIQETLNYYKSGIEIVAVNLLKADPPGQVIEAFRDVQTARADLETSRNEAEAYRNDILPKARGLAQQLLQEAQGYKQQVISHAQGEAARFVSIYDQFKEAKDVTKKRLYLETMEEVMQGMNKIIIEGKGSQGVLPYLPLPALKTKEASKGSNE